jgi:hypothetical protein
VTLLLVMLLLTVASILFFNSNVQSRPKMFLIETEDGPAGHAADAGYGAPHPEIMAPPLADIPMPPQLPTFPFPGSPLDTPGPLLAPDQAAMLGGPGGLDPLAGPPPQVPFPVDQPGEPETTDFVEDITEEEGEGAEEQVESDQPNKEEEGYNSKNEEEEGYENININNDAAEKKGHNYGDKKKDTGAADYTADEYYYY